MRISVKNGGSWTQTDALWMALSIDRYLRTQKDHPVILSFAGGGGKTSYIRRLAWEGRERGLKVLVMTTTHMAEPEHFAVFKRDLEMVRSMLEKESIAVAGRPVKDGKIAFWDKDFYKQAAALADIVLIEADGSKRLPVKVPGENEPVIPENSSVIICIYGLGAIGKQSDSCCFRLNQLEALLKLKDEEKKRALDHDRGKNGLSHEGRISETFEKSIFRLSGDHGAEPGRYKGSRRTGEIHFKVSWRRAGNINRKNV